ncbi:MAG: hypothetical protein FJ265_23055, partial [Planctomycetes bacterium]|nr:hypothetical protein [Planctomycetota bacterium]
FSVAAAPLSYRTGAEGLAPSARLYRVKLTLLAALGLCGSLLLAANGDWLVGACLGPRFQGSEVLLVAIAPVVFVKFVSSVLGDTLAAISRQDRLGLGCWIALLVNVGLGLVLMPSLGAMGAVVATLAAETVLLVFLAANVALAGVGLAWTRVLVHPFGAALAALVAAFAVTPRFAVPAAVVVALLLAWRRPTAEERLLLPRLHGGTR